MGTAALSTILLELHAAAFAAPALGCREALLGALRAHLPFDSAIWGAGTQDPPRTFSIASLDFPLDWLARYPAWQGEDALRAALAERPGIALRNEDLAPIEVHEASPIHLGFCKSAGIARTLGIATLDPTTRAGELLFLFRADRDQPFTDADRELLQQVMPHLLLADRQRQVRELSAEAVGGIAAIVDDCGHVHNADSAFGPAMCAIFPGWTGPLLPERLQALVARGGGLRCNGQAFEVRRGAGRHLLALTEAGRSPLTAAEQRAARLFARGLTATAVARELGLSVRTVRNQLASAYQKLGVASKAELAGRLGQTPPQPRD